MNICVCMAKPLSCSSETIAALLTGDTPIHNKKFKQKMNIVGVGIKESTEIIRRLLRYQDEISCLGSTQ